MDGSIQNERMCKSQVNNKMLSDIQSPLFANYCSSQDIDRSVNMALQHISTKLFKQRANATVFLQPANSLVTQ